MPLYEYHCPDGQNRFEVLVRSERSGPNANQAACPGGDSRSRSALESRCAPQTRGSSRRTRDRATSRGGGDEPKPAPASSKAPTEREPSLTIEDAEDELDLDMDEDEEAEEPEELK